MDPRTQPVETVDARNSFATWLRDGRTQKKLTIEDVARITKIQLRILERLENGQYDGLPAEVFVKGFVRSFARCVGLDESQALEKYGAAAQQQGLVVAQALAETLVPITQRKLDLFAAAEIEPPAREAPLIEARVLDTKPEPVLTAQTVTTTIEPPSGEVANGSASPSRKKQRNRKRNANQAPRSRRPSSKKAQPAPAVVAAMPEANVEAVVETNIEPVVESNVEPVVESNVEPAIEAVATHIDTTPAIDRHLGDGESLDATSIEAKAAVSDPSPNDFEVALEDGAVDSPALAEGSQRISQQSLAVEVDVGAGTWHPTMPPIASTPSVPWRRPHLASLGSTAYVVPTLVIDDADPDSADREREDRAAKEQHRLSFLPPILLDREDRSARQGGLTLAVIILLIAATLTLSYLMRRPSSRGDGVTMVETPSMLA